MISPVLGEMKRTTRAAALRIAVPAILALVGLPGPAFSATAEMQMWSCAVVGQRRPVLYLADRGARSYIKFQGQRISATHEVADGSHKWVFGANWVTLLADGMAEYYQGGAKQGVFKCKAVSN